MLYLSEILNKKITYQKQPLGKVVDFMISLDKQAPAITHILVKQNKKKYNLSAASAKFTNKQWTLGSNHIVEFPLEENKFYLVEDLLDKQVIDITGKRLVRVNDIILKEDGELKVEGIDIGLSGVFRRLGFNFASMRTITLPWSVIEAFDYQTGNIQLKLTQSRLNTFHPAEVADLLEEAGTKERLGLLKALEPEKAADAIEEADEETQTAILEQVPTSRLKSIVDQMKTSVLADIVDKVNPFTSKEIFDSISEEKAKKIRKLLVFEDDVAGGLMDISFIKVKGTTTVGEMINMIPKNRSIPETIVVVNDEDKIIGTLGTRKLIHKEKNIPLQEIMIKKKFVYEDSSFPQILRLFAQYNLRLLPVVDKDKKVVGTISIDTILAKIQEEEEIEDAI